MLSINIPKHTTPDQYELGEVPSLVVERPTDILIKVQAASINPIDVKKAAGATKAVLKDRLVLHPRFSFPDHFLISCIVSRIKSDMIVRV